MSMRTVRLLPLLALAASVDVATADRGVALGATHSRRRSEALAADARSALRRASPRHSPLVPPPLIAAKASPVAAAAGPPPERWIQLTTFAFVFSLSLVQLTPAPRLIEVLGQDNGMSLLIALSTASAALEILLAPLIGGLSDSLGRRPVVLGTLATGFAVTAATACAPSVGLIAAQKLVSSLAVGVFFLGVGAMLADTYRRSPKQLAGASGITFALLNLGFGLGIALSSLLPSSLRWRYGTAATVSGLALALGAFGIGETLPPGDCVAFKLQVPTRPPHVRARVPARASS